MITQKHMLDAHGLNKNHMPEWEIKATISKLCMD